MPFGMQTLCSGQVQQQQQPGNSNVSPSMPSTPHFGHGACFGHAHASRAAQAAADAGIVFGYFDEHSWCTFKCEVLAIRWRQAAGPAWRRRDVVSTLLTCLNPKTNQLAEVQMSFHVRGWSVLFRELG
jgi:hypothetical protein